MEIMSQTTRLPSTATGLLVLSLLLLGLVGCGGNKGNEMIAANNDTNIKRLGTMYGFFQLKNQFKGPKDEAEFKKFIGEQDAGRLALAGITGSKVDDLFLSERDKQPFKIRYGVNTQLRGPSLPVIFEATGAEGKRQVSFTGGSMQEVDSTKYDELWSGKGDQAQAAPAGDPRGKR
jgi:hypothetical protein